MNAEKDHPTIHLYGPRGLRQFVRTSLLLSQSELRFKFAVHELMPVTEQLDDKSKVRAGLEFDGGTAAICRRAFPTGRNAS